MSDNLRAKLHLDRLTFPGLSGQHLTWGILGGGFLLGMIFGGLLLFGQPERPVETAELSDGGAISPHQESASAVAPSSANAAQHSDDLSAERDRLQRELEAEKLRREVESLRRELVDLKRSPVSTEPVSTEPTYDVQRGRNNSGQSAGHTAQPEASVSGPSPGEATLAYWNRMNDVILQEAALRAAPTGGVTAANATGFLDARMQAAEFAVAGISQLDTAGVDSRVVDLGAQLIDWYTEAGEVAESGRQLLTRASVQERQGSAGKMYEAAEHRHAKNVNGINTSGEQVRQAMSRKYGLSFPPLN